jgi:hypothetical protein
LEKANLSEQEDQNVGNACIVVGKISPVEIYGPK